MKTLKTILLVSLCGLLFSCADHTVSSIVKVEGGKIEGTVENGIKTYKGIPFAAPPVGELRRKDPQPVKPWEGILKVDKFAPGAIQNSKNWSSRRIAFI